MVFFTEQRPQNEFGTGLSKAAGDPHLDEIVPLRQFAFGVVEIVLLDGVFHGGVDPVGQQDMEGRQQHENRPNRPPGEIGAGGKERQQNRFCCQEAFYPGRIRQGLFRILYGDAADIFSPAEAETQKSRGKYDILEPSLYAARSHKRGDKQRGAGQNPSIALQAMFAKPAHIARGLISFQLEHMTEPERRKKAERRRQRQKQNRHQHAGTSKNTFTILINCPN